MSQHPLINTWSWAASPSSAIDPFLEYWDGGFRGSAWPVGGGVGVMRKGKISARFVRVSGDVVESILCCYKIVGGLILGLILS